MKGKSTSLDIVSTPFDIVNINLHTKLQVKLELIARL